jgi:hypothetical protein
MTLPKSCKSHLASINEFAILSDEAYPSTAIQIYETKYRNMQTSLTGFLKLFEQPHNYYCERLIYVHFH